MAMLQPQNFRFSCHLGSNGKAGGVWVVVFIESDQRADQFVTRIGIST